MGQKKYDFIAQGCNHEHPWGGKVMSPARKVTLYFLSVFVCEFCPIIAFC